MISSENSGFEPAFLIRSLLPILLTIGILKGYRAAWVIAVVFAALGVLGFLGYMTRVDELRWHEWSSLVSWVVLTPLLIHPLTRSWASR